MSTANILFPFLFLVTTSFSQINISGLVRDSLTGIPLSGAIVGLSQNKYYDTTGSDGRFYLTGIASGVRSHQQNVIGYTPFKIGAGNRLEFNSFTTRFLRVSVIDIRGRKIASVYNGMIRQGRQSISAPVLSSGCYLYAIEMEGLRYCLPFVVNGGVYRIMDKAQNISVPVPQINTATSAELVDTLNFSIKGYYPKRLAVTSMVLTGLEIKLRKHEKTGGMILVPAKDQSFQIGQITTMAPGHKVIFTYDFLIDTTEVTQEDYYTLIGRQPSKFTNVPNGPVDEATWFDAVLYCNARSKRDGLDTVYSYTIDTMLSGLWCTGMGGLDISMSKKGYRLATTAEWEYACRGGTTSAFWWCPDSEGWLGPDTTGMGNCVWWEKNSDSIIHPVALKRPNAFGLYDMTGNVWEWVNDWYVFNTVTVEIDPIGAATGKYRTIRGGSWRSTSRGNFYSRNLTYALPDDANWGVGDQGFRCVLRK